MAVYRCEARVVGRSGGRSATAAAAYRAGERIHDARTGDVHDYARRSGVLWSDILAPENAPDWMRDRAQLWNAVEAAERRKDAQLAREFILSLPHELNDAQRAELLREFVAEQFVARGMVADVSLHAPHRQGDERNHHAHVMLTMRSLLGEGFGPKQREWNRTEQLEQWREAWAAYQNRALERAGSQERVDSRSLKDRGIEREAEPKIGPEANEMERKGRASERGDLRREVWERNRLREEFRAERNVIDLAIARLEKQREEAREKARAAQEEQYRQAAGRREGFSRGEDQSKARARDDQQEQYRKAAGQREHVGRGKEESRERPREDEQQRARRIAFEKARFEEWANRRRAELQNRQLDDKGELGRKFERQRLQLDARLAAFYGPGITEANAKLADIERRQQQRGLSGLLSRMGTSRQQDAREAEALKRNLADIYGRMNEQRGKLEREQRDSRTALGKGHKRESRDLEHRIEQAYERREREGWQPFRSKDAKQDREQQQQRDQERQDRGPERYRDRDRGR